MPELSPPLDKLPEQSAKPALACRLRKRQPHNGRRRVSSTAGEVELENKADAPIEIELQMSPFQYLNLIVRDASGSVVSEGFYGNLFSPVEVPYTLRLQPGETYVGPVSLLGNVPLEKQRAGRYTVQAIYTYKDLRAVSEPLEFQYEGGNA
jgi:hypothetical protein